MRESSWQAEKVLSEEKLVQHVQPRIYFGIQSPKSL